MQAEKSERLRRWAGGVAAILVSSAALVFLAILVGGSNGMVASAEPFEEKMAPAVAAPGAGTYRCAECGVIVSTREIEAPGEKTGVNAPGRVAAATRGEIEGKLARNYEITIRLQDGSMRTITDANPATWRHGERVKIIAGVH